MNKKLSLLDDSSDSDSSAEKPELKINKSYADNYEVWRNKEELQKLKDLSKEISSSSSTETEGEYNSEDELDFYRTLSLLKAKDPRIYDKNTVFYKNRTVEKKPKVKKPKPLYMKDYERKIVLERNGKFSSDEEEHIPAKGPTYSEEQEEIKRSFKEALGDSDEEEDNLLQVRKKTKTEKEKEEGDYIRWLKGEEVEIAEDTKKDLQYLRNYFNDPNLDEKEKFLRDFFLNRKWAEKVSDDEIPSYDVVTLSEDEKITEEQDRFEKAYNFRFEEPDEEFIKHYPRVIEDSLRKSDTRRKAKREEYAERKRKEKEQKREELKRLKALKRKEIEEKFALLKEVSGQDDINLNEEDIESDFDPDKHEQRMREMFNDDFYSVEEVQKPEFPYDEEIDAENWDSWAGEKIVDDNDSNETSKEFGANFTDNVKDKKSNLPTGNNEISNPKLKFEKEMVEATQTKKKRLKKKSVFAKAVSEPKPVYDPSGKSFDEYLDEYYKLDYEDIIGDLPVRFKYRKVVPNNFGLTVDEILAANDKDLNRWCSIKKTCQYRDEQEELYDVQAFQKKSENMHLKKKILPSVYTEGEEKQSEGIKRKRKKKSKSESSEMTNHGSKIDNINHKENKDNSNSILENFVKTPEKRTGEGQNNSQNKKKIKSTLDSRDDVTCSHTSAFEIAENDASEVASNTSRKKRVKEQLNICLSDPNGEAESTSVSESTKAYFPEQQNSDDEKINNNCNDMNFVENTKSKEIDLHEKINPCEGTDINNEGISNILKKKKKRKKKKSKNIAVTVASTNLDVSHSSYASQTNSDKFSKKNKSWQSNSSGNFSINNKNQNSTVHETRFLSEKPFKKHEKNYVKHNTDKRLNLSDDRLAAYGINPKKFKNKIKYSKN